MAKFTIVKPFKDLKADKFRAAGEVVDYDKTRADEITKKLPGYIKLISAEAEKAEAEKAAGSGTDTKKN